MFGFTIAKNRELDGSARSAKTAWILLSLLVTAIIAIYSPSLRAPFIFDDQAKIVDNPDIRTLSGISNKLVFRYHERKWERNDPSRPVTYLTFALNYHFGELNPLGYHWGNLILHALNSVLLFLLVRKILSYAYKKDHLFFPLAVAALFAVHPINSVVVCYTYNRSGALAFLFFLSSILLFIRASDGRRFLFPLSILCFVTALFAKPDAVTLPAVLLAFDFIFLSDYDISRVTKRVWPHLAFWSVLTAYLLFRYWYLGGIGDLDAGNSIDDWPRLLYMAFQPYVIISYLKLLLLPKGLCLDHLPAQPDTLLQLKFAASYLLLAGMVMVGWMAYKRKTAGSKIILFAIIWFLITLSPTSSFFPTKMVMEENRLYVSGLGFYLAVVLACHTLFKENLSAGGLPHCKRPSGLLMWTFVGTCVFCLATMTIKRSRLYQNPALVWEDALALYPNNTRAKANAAFEHNNRGANYYHAGDNTRAMLEFQKAVTINPDFAGAHYNLGICYSVQGDSPRAIHEFLTTIALDPAHKEAHNNLGVVYYQQKNYDKALEEIQKAVLANPGSAMAHTNLGILLSMRNDYQSVLREFETGLRLGSGNGIPRTPGAVHLSQHK